MIKVEIKGMDKTLAYLAGVQKQVRFAAATALTRTAQKVRDAMPAVLERDLDRPTQFTKRGLFVTRATPQMLTAVVGFKDVQAKYLEKQITGGTYQPGAHGIKLPGNIELNAFGNIPRGVINKLKAAAQNGSLSASITKRIGAAGNRRKGAAPLQLFLGKPRGRGWEKAPMGIWRRVPGNGGTGKLIPVIVFEDTPARFRPRLKFRDSAMQVVDREWQSQFNRAFADAMRSAR